MNPKRLFNLLIALTVAAGLLSAPFAAPSVAKSNHASTVGAGIHAMDGDIRAASRGMPCCPDKGNATDDCDACPLLALCAMTVAVPAPSGLATLAPGETDETAFAFPDDLLIDGLSARPPDHPPRTIV